MGPMPNAHRRMINKYATLIQWLLTIKPNTCKESYPTATLSTTNPTQCVGQNRTETSLVICRLTNRLSKTSKQTKITLRNLQVVKSVVIQHLTALLEALKTFPPLKLARLPCLDEWQERISTNVFVQRHANDILMLVCLKSGSSNCCYRLGAEIFKEFNCSGLYNYAVLKENYTADGGWELTGKKSLRDTHRPEGSTCWKQTGKKVNTREKSEQGIQWKWKENKRWTQGKRNNARKKGKR